MVTIVSVLRERLIVLEHSAEKRETIRAGLTRRPAGTAVRRAAAEYGVSGDFYLPTNGPGNSTTPRRRHGLRLPG